MTKTMLALLLMAGIILAAGLDVASGNENGAHERVGAHDWWQKNFGQYLAARSFSDAPWLDHFVGPTAKSDSAIQRQLDLLEPLRLPLAVTPPETTASGAFKTQ